MSEQTLLASFMDVTPWKRVWISFGGIVLLFLMWLFTRQAIPKASRPTHLPLAFLFICLGACLGGLIAALASPGEGPEKDTFKTIAGVISAFITGAIWTTFQQQIKSLVLYVTTGGVREVQATALAFVISIFLGGFTVYAYRVYGEPADFARVAAQVAEVDAAVEKLKAVVEVNSTSAAAKSPGPADSPVGQSK